MRTILIALQLLAMNFSALASPAGDEAGWQKLHDFFDAYSSAYAAKDASKIASLFGVLGQNVMLLPPDQDAAVGPEAIKARYQEFFDSKETNGVEKLETEGKLHDFAYLPQGQEGMLVITSSNAKYK